MPVLPRRAFATAALACTACTGESPATRSESARADSPGAPPAAGSTPAGGAAAAAAWTGPYELRGTLEGGRQARGALTLKPLGREAAGFGEAEARVKQTYPSYAGPYYDAQLSLAAGADTLRGTFSCAHGPATPPNLVCHPTTPLRGLENATLVMQPTGRAVLTGSHGEGVSVEYGRLSWTTGTT